jgi:hypothetical protein
MDWKPQIGDSSLAVGAQKEGGIALLQNDSAEYY